MIPNEDEYYMSLALKQAERALDEEEIPVGAVVVCQGKIVAKAYNQTEILTDVTAHAEMIAITSAAQTIGAKYLKDCTLYVTIEPCVMCAGAIVAARIPRVVFGAWDERVGASGSLYDLLRDGRLGSPVEVIPGVLEAECSAQIREFFQAKR